MCRPCNGPLLTPGAQPHYPPPCVCGMHMARALPGRPTSVPSLAHHRCIPQAHPTATRAPAHRCRNTTHSSGRRHDRVALNTSSFKHSPVNNASLLFDTRAVTRCESGDRGALGQQGTSQRDAQEPRPLLRCCPRSVAIQEHKQSQSGSRWRVSGSDTCGPSTSNSSLLRHSEIFHAHGLKEKSTRKIFILQNKIVLSLR